MLLVLHPYKFNQHYYFEYELDLFEKKLFSKFEIHDLSQIVNPDWKKAFSGEVHKKAKVFNTIKEWNDYFQEFIKKEDNITILNNLDINSINSLIVHHIICKSKLNIIQYRSPSIPLVKKDKIDLVSAIFNLEFLKLPKLYFFLKTKTLTKISNFIKFEKVFILYSGKKKNFKLLLNAKKNIYTNIHSKDYSKFLINKKIKKKFFNEKRYAVYLDTPGPYFFSDRSLFASRINHNIKTWYNDLNKYLSFVEKKYSLKIVIIPHPKARKIVNPYYKKSFKVIRDVEGTTKCIPKSQFVLNTGGSTALGYAVASKKPIIILYNNQIIKNDNWMFLHSKNMSINLGCSFVNINSKSDKNVLDLRVNYQKYKSFKENFLTQKKLSNKMNYDIFNKIIK